MDPQLVYDSIYDEFYISIYNICILMCGRIMHLSYNMHRVYLKQLKSMLVNRPTALEFVYEDLYEEVKVAYEV